MNAEMQNLLDEIEQLTARCMHFERKYGLSSDGFHQLYEAGRLADDSQTIHKEIGNWLSAYLGLVDRRRRVRQLEDPSQSGLLAKHS